MPVESSLVGVLSVRQALLIEVRQQVDLGMAVAVVLMHWMDLHLAEAAREGNLGCGRQIYIAKQDHFVVEEGLADVSEHRGLDGAAERQADDLAAEGWM